MKPSHRRILTAVFLLSLVSFISLLLPASTIAQEKFAIWRRYDVDITVMSSGDMRVVETQEIEFQSGTFTTGFADIPFTRTDGFSDWSVRDESREYAQAQSGQRPYTFVVSGGSIEWYFPETGPDVRTFQLAYTVRGAIPQYEEGDELQWKAISSELPAGVQSATITVHLPEGARPLQGRIVAFSPAQVQWEVVSEDEIVFTPLRALRAYEGVEVGVAFNHGAITGPKPTWQQEYDSRQEREALLNVVGGVVIFLLIVAIPLGLFLLWYLFGRDPAVGPIPEYIAEPPSDLPPGVIGTLIDEKADIPDVVATIADLGQKGYVKIEESAKAGDFGSVKRTFTVSKTGETLPETLADYEKTLYLKLFGGQNSRSLDALGSSMFLALAEIRKKMYDEVVKRGLFKSNPDAVRGLYRGLGVFGLVVFGIGFMCVGMLGVSDDIPGLFSCVPFLLALGSIALIFLAGRMPAKTRRGAEEAAKWLAFRQYLMNIEKYKDLKEATDLFEKFLPYAIAFGLERRWVSAFSKVPATPAPGWYVPHYPMIPHTVSGPQGGGRIARADTLPMPPSAGAGAAPSLSEVGQGMAGGLQSFSDGLVTMLNTTSRALNIPPATATGGGSYRYAGSGSRGFSGGSFRSSGGGFRGGGGGGGGRGFR